MYETWSNDLVNIGSNKSNSRGEVYHIWSVKGDVPIGTSQWDDEHLIAIEKAKSLKYLDFS